MKEYENKELGVKFSLPESLTVREQLGFRERVFVSSEEDIYSRYWDGVVPLLKGWQCKLAPDPAEIDLDTETRKVVADIVHWSSNMAALHMNDLDEVPKNS
jgi:hypothetical protein